jgi:hypothetical protein
MYMSKCAGWNPTPLTLGCNIIFTSRRHFELPGVLPYDVKKLSAESSYELLTKGRKPVRSEEQCANEICNSVGYLPLALVLIAAYLKNYQSVSFRDYREELIKRFANLNSFKNAINGQSGSTIDTVNNTKMLVIYQPVKVFHNTWVILLIMMI